MPDSSSAATSIACSYKQISMHAVARDTEAFPKPCVYIQLDEGSVGMGAEAEDEGEEEEEDESAELRLVPAQDSEGGPCADTIHLQLCACVPTVSYIDSMCRTSTHSVLQHQQQQQWCMVGTMHDVLMQLVQWGALRSLATHITHLRRKRAGEGIQAAEAPCVSLSLCAMCSRGAVSGAV